MGGTAATATPAAAAAAGGSGGDVESSLGLSGGQGLPRRRRFENFLKSLVGLKASGGSSNREREMRRESSNQRPASPEIRITRTPSEQDVVLRDPSGQQLAVGNAGHGSRQLSISGSSSSLHVVQQKLQHKFRRDGSASSLHQEKAQSYVNYTGLRKCETVLALTHQQHTLHPMAGMGDAGSHGGSGNFSASGVEQIRACNRLRNSVTSINGGVTCSRCSSLLSLAASGSRYSLANGFVPRPESALSLRRPSGNFFDGGGGGAAAAAGAGVETTVEAMPEPHINVNAQIRLSNGSSCGSRKSSAGLLQQHSICSSSPPSNVTTATLHSNNNNTNGVTMEETEQQPQTGGELGAFGTTNAYPLTVSSLLSMASANQSAQACCVRDGITLPTAGATPAMPIHFQQFTCKLCLIDVESVAEATTLLQCGCQFCTEVSTKSFNRFKLFLIN